MLKDRGRLLGVHGAPSKYNGVDGLPTPHRMSHQQRGRGRPRYIN